MFTPRTFVEILDDMLAYVVANSEVDDVRVGSVVRTMLEACALEDDEQYFQMVQLLDLFNIANSTGSDLDRRLADYNLFREEAKSATCRVRVSDSTRVRSTLDQDILTGATTLQLITTNGFPTSGYPYTVRVGEGTANVEDVSVTNNNLSTGELTVSATANAHNAAELAVLVAGATARTINTGTQVLVPATVGSAQVLYTILEPGVIQAGNFRSNTMLVRAVSPGPGGNVGLNRIVRFSGSPPFTGALVTNVTAASGGTLRESDPQFRTRALNQLQSLARGTPRAVTAASLAVSDPATGQRVVSSSIIEDFSTNEVLLYIDDGTGFTPDYTTLPSSALSGSYLAGVSSVAVVDGSRFPDAGWLLIEEDGVNDGELVQYSTKPTVNSFTLTTNTTTPHAASSIVRFVHILTDSAEAGQRRFRLQKYPIVRDSERIYLLDGTNPWTLVPRTDYVLNKGTGELQFVSTSGVPVGSQLVVGYSYYTNLVQQVQKVLEGDRDDPVNFPGVKAAGIFLSVEAPIIRRITVRLSISAEPNFVEADLRAQVRDRVEQYIQSLGIGENVYKSRIIDEAHNVSGVRSVQVVVPTGNITILENELPVPYNALGTSLVSVL